MAGERVPRPGRPVRRRAARVAAALLLVAVGVLVAAFLGWLAWAVWSQATPQVDSEFEGFSVVDDGTTRGLRRRRPARGRRRTLRGPGAGRGPLGGGRGDVHAHRRPQRGADPHRAPGDVGRPGRLHRRRASPARADRGPSTICTSPARAVDSPYPFPQHLFRRMSRRGWQSHPAGTTRGRTNRGTAHEFDTARVDKGRYDVPALDHTARLTGVFR